MWGVAVHESGVGLVYPLIVRVCMCACVCMCIWLTLLQCIWCVRALVGVCILSSLLEVMCATVLLRSHKNSQKKQITNPAKSIGFQLVNSIVQPQRMNEWTKRTMGLIRDVLAGGFPFLGAVVVYRFLVCNGLWLCAMWLVPMDDTYEAYTKPQNYHCTGKGHNQTLHLAPNILV